jgi:hypothetical protein
MIVPPLVLQDNVEPSGRLHEWNLNSVFRTQGNKFCFENFPRDYASFFLCLPTNENEPGQAISGQAAQQG